ncbi:MAG TPA: type II toxin-antitoxin system VapC family toxin [Microlunatus sp.]
MIIADTNVLSEPLRREPDARVLAWLVAHQDDLAVTTITVAELLHGARRLPDGRRREVLLESIERLVLDAGDRLLAFDVEAARAAAELRVAREQAGRPTSSEDLMIAAIARAHDSLVATRNTADFEGFGVGVLDPWRT